MDQSARQIVQLKKPKFLAINLFKNPIFVMIIAICAVLAIGGAASKSFIDPFNLSRLLRQMSILGLLAVGMTFVIVSGNGGVDLSVGAIFGLVCIITISLQSTVLKNTGYVQYTGIEAPIWVIFTVGILTGAAIGWFNGVACTFWQLPPFIATLCIMNIVRGGAMVYTNGFQFIGVRQDFRAIANGFIFDLFPNTFVILLIIALISYVSLHRSSYGRKVFAVGANIKAASLSGIKTRRIVISVYVISGILAAVASVLYVSFSMAGDPKAGNGYEMEAITAVLVGGTPFTGGKGTMAGTLLGLMFIYLVRNLLTHLNINSYIQQFLTALLLLIVVLIQQNFTGTSVRHNG
jgi:ribose/xylose/arabinose/galactoside ABC-type transport system permease subunit